METSIKALEDSVHGRSVPPLETMTIRLFTYYRIANEAYEAYYRKRGVRGHVYEDPQDVPEELRMRPTTSGGSLWMWRPCTTLTVRRISCGLQRTTTVNWGFRD